MEIAYSFDCEDIIDAEKAYDLYWSGVITDKKNFQCPSPGCSAQLTCANIDKPRYAMKRRPYFTPRDEHSCDCVEENAKSVGVDDSEVGRRNKYINSQVDTFLFERPKKKPQGNGSKTDLEDRHKEIKKRKYFEQDNKPARNAEYNTIKPLVSKFEFYKAEEQLDKHYVNIVGCKISYSQMFVDIDGLNLSTICKYDRIYFGEATVFKVPKKDNDFVVRFTGKIIESKEYSPTIYIANSIIQKHYWRHVWANMLNELVNSREKAIFYIYSKPKVNGKEQEYLNLQITNLNHLDYRIVEE
ncbi:hypothetical protein SPSIL_014000 [Sporomusa silvacetica DSM 10669]|uniref:Competence protein CoiA-like family protein n=1 Tax=Sporomusa silvacetica DSM 10669 TaxID=1123289 RepID=A0ABZ3IHY2_9FIRM|nr:hypothetical protein [Sporomusa silvacetica]OZC14670.1 hypothetical protein SPSIL_46140 [Sporomusa silvacetica DSM 10669]